MDSILQPNLFKYKQYHNYVRVINDTLEAVSCLKLFYMDLDDKAKGIDDVKSQ